MVCDLTVSRPGSRLRVLTYNIRSGTDVFGRDRLADQAAVLRAVGPDLVLLQEVAGADQAQRLADLAELPCVLFGAVRRRRGGEFGNAMLCRTPLTNRLEVSVAGARALGEPRGLLAATFACDDRPVHAICAHFGLLPGEAEAAARAVLGVVAERDGPLIFGGDLNRATANAVCHRQLRTLLTDSAVVNGLAPEATFPSPRPLVRLDYLYVRDLAVRATTVIPSRASDHRPLLAELGFA